MINDISEPYSIFTESSENMGILYNSYKFLYKRIDKFMDEIEDCETHLRHDPTIINDSIREKIDMFKSDITIKYEPIGISISHIKNTINEINTFKSKCNKLLKRYASLRYKIEYGGNYVHGILKKGKVYSKDIDNKHYEAINKNIRNAFRALDWVEKSLIDLFNMIDQDINILTLINITYGKHKIYESGEIESSDNSDAPLINEYDDKASSSESEEEKEKSRPKQVDKAESSKNGVRRKKLYIAFIEWCKEYNRKNTFGSIFDKDAFHVSYPFVPEEMRYFYRLANPMLCVLAGKLTFFPVADLRKVNSSNNSRWDIMIFAATETDYRVFNSKDKKVYRATDENGNIKLEECLGNTFDTYIQNMIKKGDILNAPLEESTLYFNKYDDETIEYE